MTLASGIVGGGCRHILALKDERTEEDSMRREVALPVSMLTTAACLLLSGCLNSGDDESPTDGSSSVQAQGSWGNVLMDGIPTLMSVYITSGPGYTIERIQGFDGRGRPNDQPGNAAEHDFIFEMDASAPGAADLMDYFDAYIADSDATGPMNAFLIVLKGDNDEAFRWELRSFAPAKAYENGSDGRTKFTMTNTLIQDTHLGWDLDGSDPFGAGGSYNPATDRLVQIDGAPPTFFPTVEDDTSARALTLTFDYQEGQGIFDWVRATVQGMDTIADIAVTELDSSLEPASRRNYSGCFPVAYEQFTGYDLDTKIKARVIVSYNIAEDDFD